MSSAQFALAAVDDLAGWLGEPISEATEQTRAIWALTAATDLVLDYTGRDETWDAPSRVTTVVLACAARAFTNPESWQYEAVDDWRAGGRPVEEAGLFLTASERRALDKLVSAPATRGIGIVSLDRPMPPPRWPLDGVAEALLYGEPQ